MSDMQKVDTLERVTVLRREAEMKIPNADTTAITETTFAESGGVFAARFGGFERGAQRRFHCLLLCGQSGVVTFYYEAIGKTEQETDSRARPIFNSARIAS
jgi:hypothetical protein